MPTPEIPEAVTANVAALAAADRTTVVAALRGSAPGLFQAIFQEGHNVGYGQKHSELAALQTRATAAEGQVATLTQQLTEARAGGPVDVNKLHADYKLKLDEKDKAIADLRTESVGRLESLSLKVAQSKLQKALEDLGVDPVYAEVLAEKPEIRRRLKPQEDKAVTVYQEGTEIPIVGANGKDPLHILAEELHPKVPTKFIVSKVDRGAGGEGLGGGADLDNATPEAKALDAIAASKKAELEQQRKDRELGDKAMQNILMTPAGA